MVMAVEPTLSGSKRRLVPGTIYLYIDACPTIRHTIVYYVAKSDCAIDKYVRVYFMGIKKHYFHAFVAQYFLNKVTIFAVETF